MAPAGVLPKATMEAVMPRGDKSKGGKPSISRKATNSAAFLRTKPNGGRGPP
jgi:hypothetical protein